jgi:hypothetical protein
MFFIMKCHVFFISSTEKCSFFFEVEYIHVAISKKWYMDVAEHEMKVKEQRCYSYNRVFNNENKHTLKWVWIPPPPKHAGERVFNVIPPDAELSKKKTKYGLSNITNTVIIMSYITLRSYKYRQTKKQTKNTQGSHRVNNKKK